MLATMGTRQTWLKRLGLAALVWGFGALASVWIAPSCTVFSDVTLEQDAGAGDADAGEPVADPATYLSLVDGARFCARAAACPDLFYSVLLSNAVPIDSENFSQCMSWVAGPIPAKRIGLQKQREALACIAGTETCAESGACLAFEVMSPTDPRCADAGGPETCVDNGGSTLYCTPTFAQMEHCTAPFFPLGTSCLEGAPDGSAICASAAGCTADSCDGAVLYFCNPALDVTLGVDCEVVGNTCGFDSSVGLLNCLADGNYEYCQNLSYMCDGDRVKVCHNAGVSLFDCTEFGATCSEAIGSPRCVRPTDECTPFDADINLCEGNNIKLCVGGERIDFDCASIGKTCTGTVAAQCL
jgi:hypothetical protein